MRYLRAVAVVLLVSLSLVTATASVAHAVTASDTDPTGDTDGDATYDVVNVGVTLTETTVSVTVTFAGALPALSDNSWANNREVDVLLGPALGEPGFAVGRGTNETYNWDSEPCDDNPTISVSGSALTVSGPADCFDKPGKVQVSVWVSKMASPDAVDFQALDIAIAPEIAIADEDSALYETVDASLGGGYYLLGADGGVFAYGDAPFYGSTGSLTLNSAVVGMSAQPSGNGYRFVAGDGGIFAYGNAPFYGSMGGKSLNSPVVGMATTSTGNGYWLVSSDGGIFAYGDADFYGSMGGLPLNKPVVGMVPSATGNGYLLVASDGGLFAFGDADFHGSMGGESLNQPIVGVVPTDTGDGYYLTAKKDGGLFAFGDASFYGSAVGRDDVDAVAVAAGGADGYYIASAGGRIDNFGTALQYGDPYRSLLDLNRPIVGMAVIPN